MDDGELPRRIGIGLLCTLVALSGVWFIAAGDRRVTVRLTVESVTRTITTGAPTVAGLLDEQSVVVRPDDVVRPPATAPLVEGLTVDVLRGRHVTLVLDGRATPMTTVAGTVKELLDGSRVHLPQGSVVDPSASTRLAEGLRVSVRRPSVVTVRHDDVQEVIVTTAPSVRDLLSEHGLTIGADDAVEPSLGIVPEDRLVVTLVRSGTHDYTVRDRVPPPLQVEEDEEMPYGKEIVRSPGREGLTERVYRATVSEGTIRDRALLREIVLTKALPRVVTRGVKRAAPRDVPSAPPPGAEVASEGLQVGRATWYDRAGMAAAHLTLPFGTVVKVTNVANDKSVYVTIDDRGPYGAGNIIDLSPEAFSAIGDLGTGVLDVRIEW